MPKRPTAWRTNFVEHEKHTVLEKLRDVTPLLIDDERDYLRRLVQRDVKHCERKRRAAHAR